MLLAARFPFALAVVIAHWLVMTGGVTGENPVLVYAAAAVPMFFCLSGFVLVLRYVNDKPQPFPWAEYCAARVARLYPVYILALVISAPVAFDAVEAARVEGVHLQEALYLTPFMLQAWDADVAVLWNGPAWSLSVEAFMYVLFPIQVCLARRIAGGDLWCLGVAACAAVVSGACMAPENFAHHPLGHWVTFSLGAVLAVRRRELQACIGVRQSTALWLLLALEAFALQPALECPAPAQRLAVAAGSGALVLLLSRSTASLPERQWAQRLGLSSYALYLLHVPIAQKLVHEVMHDEMPQFVAMPLFVVGSVCAALAVQAKFEAPFDRRIRRRLVGRVKQSRS